MNILFVSDLHYSSVRVIKTAQTFHTPGVCLVTENEYNIDGTVSTTENRLYHPSGNHTDRHTFVYDNVDRLLQERVSFDANGNTLSDCNKGVTYSWDYNNMLSGALF